MVPDQRRQFFPVLTGPLAFAATLHDIRRLRFRRLSPAVKGLRSQRNFVHQSFFALRAWNEPHWANPAVLGVFHMQS